MKQEIVHKPIADLIPYANNARTHSDTQVAQIAASIKEFGFTNPILVDGTNGIIAGHGRLMAARKLGLDTVPCIELSHLSEAQRKAYILADNLLAMNSGWDTQLLSLELKGLDDEGFDLEMLGFDVDELTLSMGLGADFEPGTEGEQGKLDEKAPIICPSCSHEFHK
jgi:ParB family chromosome partitioning protein